MEQDSTGSEIVKSAYQGAKLAKQTGSLAKSGVTLSVKAGSDLYKAATSRQTRLEAIISEIKTVNNLTERLKSVELEILDIEDKINEKSAIIERLSSIENKSQSELNELKQQKEELKILKSRHKKLDKEGKELSEGIVIKSSNVAHIKHSLKPRPIRTPAKFSYKVVKGTLKTSFRVTKNVAAQANPLNKRANFNDTTDTGVESLKLGYTTVKKTYQTGKKAVRGVRVLYKAPVKTVKFAVGTVKVASSIVIHTVALLLNPIFWALILLFVLVFLIIMPAIIILLGGGAASGSTTNKAYGTAAGANKDILTAYAEAEEFYRIAAETRQNDFNSMIDSLYFSTDDLKHSDLVYMKCSHDGSEYQTSMATNSKKNQLKTKFSNSLPKAEAIALVYVYLEKQKNDENSTIAQIYEVEFTQQAFDDLLNQMISWTETIYSGQECPNKNCSVREEHNPEWDTAKYNRDMSVNAFNEWATDIQPRIANNTRIKDGAAQSQDWDANIGWRIDNWNLVYSDLIGNAYTSNDGLDCLADLDRISDYYIEILDKTPENFQVVDCEHLHNNHAIGLNIISKESVMDSWGFDDNYRQWVELTYQGFLVNPDLQN